MLREHLSLGIAVSINMLVTNSLTPVFRKLERDVPLSELSFLKVSSIFIFVELRFC